MSIIRRFFGSYYALELSEFLLFSIYYILYLKGGEAQIGNILIFEGSLYYGSGL